MTAQDLINLAAKDVGALASGETLNAEEYPDCLLKLNQLIAEWDIEYLNIFCISRAAYPMTAGRTTPYQIGPSGADFVAPRPISIRAANVVTGSGGFEFGLQVIPVEQWNAIVEKSAVGDPPEVLYYDNDYPNALLYLNPWPAAEESLVLYTWEQLNQLASLSSTFDMPPGYAEALEWNLAISLAPMFGRPLDATVAAKAQAAKASIRANNVPPAPGRAQVIQAGGAAVPIPPDASNAMNR
jgi:hypothetical protein